MKIKKKIDEKNTIEKLLSDIRTDSESKPVFKRLKSNRSDKPDPVLFGSSDACERNHIRINDEKKF